MMGKGPVLPYPLKMQVLQTQNLDNSCSFGVVSGEVQENATPLILAKSIPLLFWFSSAAWRFLNRNAKWQGKYLLCAKTDPATRKSKRHNFISVTCLPHNCLTNFSCSENKTTTQCWHTQGIGPTGGYLRSFPPTQSWHSCLRHLPCCQYGWYDWDAQRIGQGIVSCF